ncbi:MAG: pyridoxamine 5'-phosphate oxidase family protein [Candidatus Micrarchaeota archaeon]|nr:pyridoxamine 5'-phosphate oxidase family protein [Candidatus Micrarchaeota archaeon]MDE1804192.1 pyridoxamine 5'-phosphate oxidase family protein [Candidatus Micrarchaeota archaeon]MDE1846700.1 pyridoxamine 5'-phosphate oxidase family protein [Candidatus Micrarchaeota archaeon]
MEGEYKSFEDKAKRIIESNNYMVTATTDKRGNVWAATVSYVHDKDYNFYFLSPIDSRHGANIIDTAKIAFEIFDSRQKIGSADGVQAEGKAVFAPDDALEEIIKIYVKKFFPNSSVPATERYPPENYRGAAEFRFFKIKLSGLFVTGEDISVLGAFAKSNARRVSIDPKKI